MSRRGSSTVRLVAGLALVIALAAITPLAGTRALAQADNNLASITIYTAVCPSGYAGNDLFGDCFDNPGADIAYLLTGPAFPETVTTSSGADGLAAFEGIDEPGEYLLQVDVPLEFASVVAFCSDEFGDPFPVADESAVGGVGLDLTLDDDLRCDFYIIPEDLSGRTPTPQPTQAPQATSTVGALPNTGTGPNGIEGGTSWPLAWALALLVVAGAASTVRARLVRAEAPPHR
jgi:hypothetical protein